VTGGGGEHKHVYQKSMKLGYRCLELWVLFYVWEGLMRLLLLGTALTVHMTITKGRKYCRRSVQ
jgi:hypothetical protein